MREAGLLLLLVFSFLLTAGYSYQVYQQPPNATSCTGTFNGVTGPCTNAYDGNWTTFAGSINSNTIFMNYSKPSGTFSNMTWEVEDETARANISIPSSCVTGTVVQLKAHVLIGTTNSTQWSCDAGGTWTTLRAAASSKRYDTAAYFEMVPTPTVIASCAASSYALNFTAYDENNQTYSPNMTFEITLDTVQSDGSNATGYSFTYPENTTSQQICISPTSGTLIANTTVKYSSTGYAPRYYYLINSNLTNTTLSIPLYLLKNANATTTDIYVQDASGNNAASVILDILRWWVGTNTYSTVAMVKTDQLGTAETYLDLNSNYYRVVAYENGIASKIFDPMQIIDINSDGQTSITLTLATARYIPYTSDFLQISSSCWRTNTSIVCTALRTTGESINATLVVSNYSQKNASVLCTSAQVGLVVINSCPVTNYSGALYGYHYEILGTDVNYTANSGVFEYETTSAISSEDQLTLTSLLVMGLAFGYVFVSPGAIPVLIAAGLAAAKFMGIFSFVSWEVLGGLVVVGIIIALKTKG